MHYLSTLSPWMLLPILAVVCYFQNMAFTWSSRSRNSGDANFHRYAAWASNGVYLLTHTTFLYLLYRTFTSGNLPLMIGTFVVYTLSTTEGSVKMMKIMIAKTKGKRAVQAVTEEDLKKIHAKLDAGLVRLKWMEDFHAGQIGYQKFEELKSAVEADAKTLIGKAKQDLSKVMTPIINLREVL